MSKKKPTKKPAEDKTVWDKKIRQLGLRTRGAVQSWIVEMRDDDGKRLRRTLGTFDALSRDDAREQARSLLEQGAEVKTAAHISIRDFNTRYMADRSSEWVASTIKSRHCLTRQSIDPQLGDIMVADLTVADVTAWQEDLQASPGSKNVALAHVSGMMRHAELLGLRTVGTNPCKGMRKRKSGFKASYLSDDEFSRLGKALRRAEKTAPAVADFIRILALSGARFSEVKSLLWTDLETDRIYLPNSKGGPRTIWLGDSARHVLSSRPRRGPHVFQSAGKPVSENIIRVEWNLIRKRAKLPGLRLHDLRHSFASVAVCQGTSLRTIGGLLGHKRLDVTQSYAHLAEAPLKASARRVANGMERKLSVGRTRRAKADRRGRASASPMKAPEFEMVRLFIKSGSTLPPFCVEHGLDRTAFYGQVLKFRKLIARDQA